MNREVQKVENKYANNRRDGSKAGGWEAAGNACVKNKAAAEENSIQETQGRRLLLLLSVCIVAKVASTFGNPA